MWVARVLKRSENTGEAKPPSLRTVSQEACSVLAWNPGGTSTAVGCNIRSRELDAPARAALPCLGDGVGAIAPDVAGDSVRTVALWGGGDAS